MAKDSIAPPDDHAAHLSALVGSRLCHDLVSPLGAVSNGIELLELMGQSGEELDMMKGALGAALARLRFFRLAFGGAGDAQLVAARDLRALCAGLDARAALDWRDPRDLPRTEARLGCLMLACLEHATPWGGAIVVEAAEDGLRAEARAERFRAEDRLWDALAAGAAPDSPSGGEVQFALLAHAAAAAGRLLRVERDAGRIALTV